VLLSTVAAEGSGAALHVIAMAGEVLHCIGTLTDAGAAEAATVSWWVAGGGGSVRNLIVFVVGSVGKMIPASDGVTGFPHHSAWIGCGLD
jgi:hypothetical protein